MVFHARNVAMATSANTPANTVYQSRMPTGDVAVKLVKSAIENQRPRRWAAPGNDAAAEPSLAKDEHAEEARLEEEGEHCSRCQSSGSGITADDADDADARATDGHGPPVDTRRKVHGPPVETAVTNLGRPGRQA